MIARNRMWLGLFAFGLFVSFSQGAIAADGKITGTWTWTVKRNDMEIKNTMKVKQDGEKLTGEVENPRGKTEIKDGKVDKDGNATWTVTREFNGNSFTIKYKGKVEGDVLKLNTTIERNGETTTTDYEAKRVDEKS